MKTLLDPWQLPHHPARPLLLFRGICALLAFDAWTLMLEHGGRYGIGPFNVAHFDIVDRLVPMPTAALYLGLVSCAGCYAFVGALGLLRRAEALLLWGLYTLAWMLSMHDSYQHHYLLSWLLGFSLFTPALSVRECVRSDARVRESGFPLVAGCCAMVYLFTAISKSSGLWSSGAVLRKLAADGGPMAWAPEALMRMGFDEVNAWRFAARSIVALQLVVTLGFVSALLRDFRPSRLLAFSCALALLAATSFHVATELTPSFAIGWFSYYMLWIVWISLLPAPWLAALMRVMERFRTTLNQRMDGWWMRARVNAAALPSRVVFGLLSLASSLVFMLREDLPGVGLAAFSFSCALSLRILCERQSTRKSSPFLAWLPLVTLAALSLTLSLTHVRFDYYRRAAGELARMERTDEALALYRKAELHAPSGQSRRGKIEELERSKRASPRPQGARPAAPEDD